MAKTKDTPASRTKTEDPTVGAGQDFTALLADVASYIGNGNSRDFVLDTIAAQHPRVAHSQLHRLVKVSRRIYMALYEDRYEEIHGAPPEEID